MKITLNGHVTVALGTGGHGQSIATTMAQIAADELGVDFADVTVIEGDTDISPIGGGTGGSRSGVIGGAAVHQSASQVRENVVAIAAHMLEAAPNDLEIAQRSISVRGTPSRLVLFAEVVKLAYVSTAKLPPQTEGGLEAITRYETPSITWANACHICTVEISDTSEVKLLRYIISEDCGVMINPMVVEGQISGGVVQGIGAVIHEGFVYDDAGNPLTTTFLDYLIPTTTDIPVFQIGHMETPAGPVATRASAKGALSEPSPQCATPSPTRLAEAGAPGITGPVRPVRRARSTGPSRVADIPGGYTATGQGGDGMIALPALMIAAGAVLWAVGDTSSSGFADVLGLVLISGGTLWLAALVVTGRWWKRRQRSLPDSSRV